MAEVKAMYHSSIRIKGEKTVYFDPFKVGRNFGDADVIFVTHDHFDHFSEEDIKKVMKDDTVLVVPEPMKKAAAKLMGENRVITVKPDESYNICGLSCETVSAYNIGRPFHKKADNWVGYIVTVDGERFYAAGDTDRIPENEKVKCDTALVPIGGKFTMDFSQAAGLVNLIRPKRAIPTHYGSVAGSPEDGDRFMELIDGDIKVELHF